MANSNILPGIIPAKTRLGWVGTGVMGRWMCQHCIKAGFLVTVFNRTHEKAFPLLEMGAELADSAKAVALKSDVVITMVGHPHDVKETILGEQGILAGLKSGGIIVDMSTSEPSLAVFIAEKAQSKGVHALDAPVSGGDVGAREARLAVMVGGDEAIFTALTPLWQAMAKTFTYMGPPGSGQHTKMVNQIAISSTMVGLVEAMLYAQRAGLDLTTVLAAIGQGAAGSWSLTNYGPRIIERNFNPGFFVEHFIKDMGIALDEAKKMNLSLPGLSLVHQLYIALKAQGGGRLGTQALLLALEHLNSPSSSTIEKIENKNTL